MRNVAFYFLLFLSLLTQSVVFALSNLPNYELLISEENLAKLERKPKEYVGVVFICNGEKYRDVEARHRGQLGLNHPKRSYKVKFKSRLFQGRHKINLVSDYNDKSLMRNLLSLDLFRKNGVLAPRIFHVNLFINGDFAGVYADVEQVDEYFLLKRRKNPSGELYKARGYSFDGTSLYSTDPKEIRAAFEKEGNGNDNCGNVIGFINFINRTPAESLTAELPKRLNVRSYATFLAVNILVGNLDAYRKNYYLYHDTDCNMWEVIPWDCDLSFGNTVALPEWDSGGNSTSHAIPIETRITENKLAFIFFSTPALRKLLEAQIHQLIQGGYAIENISARIDEVYNRIKDSAYKDTAKWSANAEFDTMPANLKNFVSKRTAFVLSELKAEWLRPELLSQIGQNRLHQNYPNSFHSGTFLPYQVITSGNVSIEIYDATGRLVRDIFVGFRRPGIYTSRELAGYWNGENDYGEPLARGVYFYTVIATNFVETKKMLRR